LVRTRRVFILEIPISAAYCWLCGTNRETNKIPSKIEGLESQIKAMQEQMDKLMVAAAHGTVAKAKKRSGEE